MKNWLLALLLLLLHPVVATAKTLDLAGYQDKNGAITVKYQGDKVDPYFAILSLLISQKGKMDITKPAMAWVKWAINIQRPDGLFERYETDGAGGWKKYAVADADDAVLALWLELLYVLSPSSGLPKTWADSATKAEAQLDKLYNPQQGIYYISQTLPVGLFMDNIEIYDAYKSIAQQQRRMGLWFLSIVPEYKAARLKRGILTVFKPPPTDMFLVSTQGANTNSFYPDHVAQIFPLLYGLESGTDTQQKYQQWIKANGKEWFKQGIDDYPWGLVAILSLNMNDTDSASCWLQNSEPMRYSKHWNVLEEAASQQVKWRLSNLQDKNIPCIGKDLL